MPEHTSSTYNLPPWAVRIRREREARGLSVPKAAEALLTYATDDEEKGFPDVSTVKRRWNEWESGRHNPAEGQGFYAPIIARMFGVARYALFPQEPQHGADSGLLVSTGMETADILARIQRSDVDTATLDGIARTIDALCSEYPYMPSEQLIIEGRQWLRRVVDIRGQRLTLNQYRDVLVMAGWLALLVGCVENDMGDRRQAETTRKMALDLGVETGHAEIIGWAHEMRAWFALTDSDYRGVIAASKAGIEAAGEHGVTVQLLAQEAKAWARIGDRRQMEVALDRGRQLIDTFPYPDNLDHHFTVDPAKFDFYAMDCYRLSGVNDLAHTFADEVIRTSTRTDGIALKPMRIAEAQVTLGVLAARQGDVEQAVSYGHHALEGDRKSLPSLLMVSSELSQIMQQNYKQHPTASSYLEELHDLRKPPTH